MKRVSGILLIIYMIFTPYIYGVSDSLLTDGGSVLIFIVLLLYLARIFWKRYDFLEVVGLVPLSLFLLLPLVQLIPLPPLIVEAISPNTYQLYKPLLALSSEERWISLAIVPVRTLHYFFLYCGYAATYILVQQLFSHRDTIKNHIAITLAVLTGFGVLSLFINLDSNGTSISQFVGMIWLAAPVSFGMFLYYRPVVMANTSPVSALRLLYKEPGFHLHVFYFCCFTVMVLALLMALEWGALFSIYITVISFLILFSFKFTGTIRPLAVLLVVLIGTVIAGFLGDNWIYSIGRGAEGSAVVQTSPDILRASLAIIQSFPLLGTGLGSCDHIYPFLAGQTGVHGLSAQPSVFRLFLEVGSVGVLLLLWLFLSFLRSVWGMVKKRGDRFVTMIGIGSISGLVALLLHSCIFPEIYGGATGFYLAGLMGFTVAAVNCRFQYYESISYCRQASQSFRLVLTILTLVILTLSLLFYSGRWYAGYLERSIPFVSKDTLPTAVKHKVEQDTLLVAIGFDPLESIYSYKLGLVELGLEHEQKAVEHLLNSGLKNIMNGLVFHQLALLGDKEDSQRLELLDLGYRRAPQSTILAQQYGEWLLGHTNREDALKLVHEAIALDFSKVESWVSFLQSNMVTREELKQILPQKVEVWLTLARYSEKNNALYKANFYHAGALELAGKSSLTDPEWFLEIHDYYLRQKRTGMAVLVIRRAVTLLPREAIFHRLLGDYYRSEGVQYRAIEEYEQALMLDPGDTLSQDHLRLLRGQIKID